MDATMRIAEVADRSGFSAARRAFVHKVPREAVTVDA